MWLQALRPFLSQGWASSRVALSASVSPLVEPMLMQAHKISQGRTLTGTDLNSFEGAKTLNNSSVDIVELGCWL